MKRLLAAFLCLSPFLVQAQGVADSGLAQFQVNVDERLKGDYVGYVTPYSGIYSLTSADESQPKTPIMADQGLTMLANSFTEAWSYFGKDHLPVQAEKVKALRARAAAELPLHSSIVIKQGDAPVSMAIYSAVDCGFCRRLEGLLTKHKLSYAVFPGSLYRENFPLAKSVWCNANPAQAWQDVMQNEKTPPAVASCPSYPIADIRYTGALFSYGNTPGIIFADGDVIARLPQGADEEAEFLQIVQAKIAKGAVFKTPPAK